MKLTQKTGRKENRFSAVFLDTIRRESLPNEPFIYKTKVTTIKTVLKET